MIVIFIIGVFILGMMFGDIVEQQRNKDRINYAGILALRRLVQEASFYNAPSGLKSRIDNELKSLEEMVA